MCSVKLRRAAVWRLTAMHSEPAETPAPIQCVRCSIPMVRVRVESWSPSNILLKQLQKIADGAGLRFYHCKQCGKIEFFK